MLQDVIEPAKWSHFSCVTYFVDVYNVFGGVFSIYCIKLIFFAVDMEKNSLQSV